MAAGWIPFYAFGVFFTPLLIEFGWSRAVTAGGFSACQMVRGMSGVGMGRLTDKAGPRIFLTISGLLLGAGFILMYYVDSLWQFYLFYTVLMGIGLGGFWVPLMSTVARWFVKKRATMSGIVLAAGGLGTLVGAPMPICC
jgi:OFA family oxalate/formate antiporter-like MFS transporter